MTADAKAATKAGPRVPIDEQIATVRRVTDARASYLESRISAGRITVDRAQREIVALEEALRSLNVVRRHADEFRDFLRAKRAFEAERRRQLAGEDDAAAAGGGEGAT